MYWSTSRPSSNAVLLQETGQGTGALPICLGCRPCPQPWDLHVVAVRLVARRETGLCEVTEGTV